MNLTIKAAAKVAEELNQSNEKSDIKKLRYSTYKSQIRIVLTEKLGNNGQYVRSIEK